MEGVLKSATIHRAPYGNLKAKVPMVQAAGFAAGILSEQHPLMRDCMKASCAPGLYPLLALRLCHRYG
jgi:hypothetical protein